MRIRIVYILLAAITGSTILMSTACKQSESSSSDDSSTQVSVEESIEEQESSIDEKESSDDEESSEYKEDPYKYFTTGKYNYEYIITNDKFRLLKYHGAEDGSTEVIVPETYSSNGKDYPTEIGAGCFKDTDITSLVLPNNITEIPDSMCENCKQLESVRFSNVESIGEKAFLYCKNLSFQFSELNNGNPTILKKIGNNAFGLTAIEGKVVISSELELGECCFTNCERISEVEFQSGITTIPGGAFQKCKNLGEVNLPDTLEQIGICAFFCTSFQSITIPKSVKEIGGGAITTYINVDTYTGVIYGYKDTAAEKYAKENNITFSPLD